MRLKILFSRWAVRAVIVAGGCAVFSVIVAWVAWFADPQHAVVVEWQIADGAGLTEHADLVGVRRPPARLSVLHMNVTPVVRQAYATILVDPDEIGPKVPGWSRPSALGREVREGAELRFNLDDGFGWPLACMRYRVEAESIPNDLRMDAAAKWGLDVGVPNESWLGLPVLLPMRPIWSGLLVNSAYPAAAFLIVYSTLCAMRNRRNS